MMLSVFFLFSFGFIAATVPGAASGADAGATNLFDQQSDGGSAMSDRTDAGMFQIVADDEFLARLRTDADSAMCVAPRSVKMTYHQLIARLTNGFELKADVYYREKQPARRRPALVFMHDWASGKQPKICGDRQCNYLALTENLFCVALYYRQPRDGKYPAALEDLKCCLRWLRAVAADYAIDPDKIAVMGSSAGTQWTWLAAASNGSKQFDGSGGHAGYSSDVNLAVINAGICDFVGDFGKTGIGAAILGGTGDEMPAQYLAASPLHQARAGMPPVLMIHGELDKTCPLSSAEAMARKLRELHVPVELVVRKGCGHGLGGFGADLHDNLEVVREFIRRQFKL